MIFILCTRSFNSQSSCQRVRWNQTRQRRRREEASNRYWSKFYSVEHDGDDLTTETCRNRRTRTGMFFSCRLDVLGRERLQQHSGAAFPVSPTNAMEQVLRVDKWHVLSELCCWSLVVEVL